MMTFMPVAFAQTIQGPVQTAAAATVQSAGARDNLPSALSAGTASAGTAGQSVALAVAKGVGAPSGVNPVSYKAYNQKDGIANTGQDRKEALISAAYAQLGKRYVRGGKGPDTFDCSGFVYYALQSSGNGVPYMTSRAWAESSYPRVDSMDDLQRGDVVCFRGHVGIYLGSGAMIDASSSRGKVRITFNIKASPYWQRSFICGRRPVSN